jgi:hypothetical protein
LEFYLENISGTNMTILIANIGNSDLSIKVDEYYFPVGFDRNEPNIDYSGLTPDDKVAWDERKTFIEQTVCHELGLDKFSFREFTKRLKIAYIQDNNKWHQRIRPGRIWGVIKEARDRFQIKNAYIFITNQPPGVGYDTDSIHLFELLQYWFNIEFTKDIKLHPIFITENISAINQDGLLHEYYKFFGSLDKNEQILISIKGGTYQMQTALRVQAMSSEIQNQIFLDPILSIKDVLAGEPSRCQQISYWRYNRTQKYQIIKQLLERWDFDGSSQILKEWIETLEQLSKSGVTDIADSKAAIESVVKSLDMAVCYFNLDSLGARRVINSSEALGIFKQISVKYNKSLNLYTQCCIYWELNQVANFLSRLGSFCEENLHYLIIKLDGLKYFDKINYAHDWYLDKRKVEPRLWQYFEQNENKNNSSWANWNFQHKPKYRLPGRFSKWNFVNALIQHRDKVKEKASWEKITTSLDNLDYWIEKRNNLIHSAEGISKENMSKILKEDKENCDNEQEFVACKPEEIIAEITIIINQTYKLLNLTESKFVNLDKTNYYIYSEVKNWVIDKLMTDGLS